LIKNSDCVDFKDKIQKTKEAVLDVLGKSAGTHFHKKFLLKKDGQSDPSAIPLDLSKIDTSYYEELFLQEVFIDYQSTKDTEVISCSVERKGSKNSFAYTHKLTIMKNGQKILKKRNISASDFITAMGQQKKGTRVIKTKRVCIIDNGVYIIVDYYNETDGQPLTGIIQVRQSNQSKIELPPYIQTYRDITDEPQYLPEIMCKEDYYMDEQDKKGTNK